MVDRRKTARLCLSDAQEHPVWQPKVDAHLKQVGEGPALIVDWEGHGGRRYKPSDAYP